MLAYPPPVHRERQIIIINIIIINIIIINIIIINIIITAIIGHSLPHLPTPQPLQLPQQLSIPRRLSSRHTPYTSVASRMSYLASSRSLLRNSRAAIRLPTTIARTFSSTTPNMAITEAQTAIVKSTAPILKEHSLTITTVFYKSMLGAHPELHNIFNISNQRSGAQQKSLANALLAYATHIDELQKLGPAVERIAQKHVSLGITPDQYAIVGEHLIKAIATVLGDGLTPEPDSTFDADNYVLETTGSRAVKVELFQKVSVRVQDDMDERTGKRGVKMELVTA
ncbi:Flavohemoprotein like [Verticillium longisporum]|nr:Flavohemoprotein like [Verticillium longisporum]